MWADRFEDESLLRLAAIEVYEDAVKEYESLREDDSPAISQRQVDEQFKQLMARYRQEQGAHRFRSLPRKVLRRAVTAAAAIAILCSSAFTVAMASSPTIREIILEDFGDYSDLWMLLSGEQKAACPEGWNGKYYPTYIPEGYQFTKIDQSASYSSIFYIDHSGKVLEFTVFKSVNGYSVNTEKMWSESITINDRDAIRYSLEDDTRSFILINYEDFVIFIHGSLPYTEILNVAKSISAKK